MKTASGLRALRCRNPKALRTVCSTTRSSRRHFVPTFWNSESMSTALKKERKLERPPRGGLATMVEAIRQGLWEEMERDPTVFIIGEDVGVYGGAFKVTEGI